MLDKLPPLPKVTSSDLLQPHAASGPLEPTLGVDTVLMVIALTIVNHNPGFRKTGLLLETPASNWNPAFGQQTSLFGLLQVLCLINIDLFCVLPTCCLGGASSEQEAHGTLLASHHTDAKLSCQA